MRFTSDARRRDLRLMVKGLVAGIRTSVENGWYWYEHTSLLVQYLHIWIYMFTYLYNYVHIYLYLHIHIYIHIYIYLHIYTYIHQVVASLVGWQSACRMQGTLNYKDNRNCHPGHRVPCLPTRLTNAQIKFTTCWWKKSQTTTWKLKKVAQIMVDFQLTNFPQTGERFTRISGCFFNRKNLTPKPISIEVHWPWPLLCSSVSSMSSQAMGCFFSLVFFQWEKGYGWLGCQW